jgi:hypothetical protein
MPHLKALHITKGQTDKLESWAVPFASGGLSELSLYADMCGLLGGLGNLSEVDAILSAHAHTLKRLTLDGVPGDAQTHEFAPGPKYNLNRLEYLSVCCIEADEHYIQRFSNCPIRYLKVTICPRVLDPAG